MIFPAKASNKTVFLTSPVVLQASVPRHSVQIGTTCGFYTKYFVRKILKMQVIYENFELVMNSNA